MPKTKPPTYPRWIYHHLRFGFDEIDIYVNNTTDNSVAVLDKISSQFPVRVIAADFIYERRRSISFQREAYSIILQDAIKQDVTHLLFLDIDEFWTPRDLVTSIRQCLEDTGYPDVISFAWANKVDEDVTFAGPYSQHTRSIENVHVKSLFRTSLKIRKLEVDNVISDNATYLLGDGRENLRKGKSTIDPQELGIEGPKRFFILHRMWRSQIEYISRLGQGKNLDRNGKAVSTFDLKRNRKGFMVPFLDAPESTFEIQEEVLDEYETGYREFLSTCDLEASMEEAQEFIIDRAKMVWRELPAARANNPRLVEKLLSNIAIGEVEAILDPEGEVSRDGTFIPWRPSARKRLQFWLESRPRWLKRRARRLPAPLKLPLRAVRDFARAVSSRLDRRPWPSDSE